MATEAIHHQLMAEAMAFPFASAASFARGVTALERDAPGVLAPATRALADDLEPHLRVRARGLSLDVLRHLRDAAWFPGGARAISLGRLLVSMADAHLEFRGDRAALRATRDPSSLAPRWRWLTLAMPEDLLIAALAAQRGSDAPYDHCLLVTPQLARVLDQPCAETHLHVGSSIPFPVLWTSLARTLADSPPEVRWLREHFPDAERYGGAERWLQLLQAAFVTRTLLASFLWRHARDHACDFERFLQHGLAAIVAKIPSAWSPHQTQARYLRVVALLLGRAPTVEPSLARILYRHLVGPAARPRQCGVMEAIFQSDPLAAWFPPAPEARPPETRWACRALQYALGEGSRDALFARCFWQYQRVRSQLHRFLVEEPGTAGLEWFTRHYNRIWPLRGAVDRALHACALHTQSLDLRLGALEARVTPGSSWTLVRDEARRLVAQAARFTPATGQTRPEVGLIFHFLKEWQSPGSTSRRLHADPRNPIFGTRHGRWFHERARQARALATMLGHHPELLLVVRGVDVASVELATPTWVVTPLFEIVREASVRATSQMSRLRPAWRLTPMRATVHAGEDFRRLSEGLRHIHEAIEAGLVRFGDRLGHAIALGEDPAADAERHAVVAQPLEERLDDLLWELDRYRSGDLPVDAGRLESARAEALALGRRMYAPSARDERGFDLDVLVDARRLRHQPEALLRTGYPYSRATALTHPAYRLMVRYLTDGDTYERGQWLVEVESRPAEVRMLAAAQAWLRALVGRMELTIESNPSSNLLVGDMSTLARHPAFTLQPLPGEEAPAGGAVLLSVNTDNPITFSSCLADEYAHVYHALLRHGVRAREALDWIDRVRENGWRSRFTLPASAEPGALASVLPPTVRSAR
jgi:hypothetical protein